MNSALNGICPYFTMFPLEFPLAILTRHGRPADSVLDPFCGRGTTLYAARLREMTACGLDSNPVAVAISQAKLANVAPLVIVRAAAGILRKSVESIEVPEGEFWSLAFAPAVLEDLCRLRQDLLTDCRSDARRALRGIILGALHGPLTKTAHSYFSNQCPRTFAPKPRYAVRFWKARKLAPPRVDVLEVIRRRADRFYGEELTAGIGLAAAGDSRDAEAFEKVRQSAGFSWLITSPPYYGMRTYVPDQWLRNWFLGERPRSPTRMMASCSIPAQGCSPINFGKSG